jgi:hypothetical protein
MFGEAEAQLARPVAPAACPRDLDHRCGRWRAAVTRSPKTRRRTSPERVEDFRRQHPIHERESDAGLSVVARRVAA